MGLSPQGIPVPTRLHLSLVRRVGTPACPTTPEDLSLLLYFPSLAANLKLLADGVTMVAGVPGGGGGRGLQEEGLEVAQMRVGLTCSPWGLEGQR